MPVDGERFVWVRVNYLCISAIDTKSQKFSAEVLIEARWMQRDGEGEGDCEQDDKERDKGQEEGKGGHFDPKLVISNLDYLRKEKCWHRIESTEKCRRWVFLCWRLTGDFYENLELENFPRDVQDLSIWVSSELHADEIELLVEDRKLPTIDVNNFRANQEWNLFHHVESEKLPETPNSDVELGSTAGFIVAKCRVARRSEYFFLNNVLVMFCLVVLSFTIYAFAPTSNMPRIGSSINLLLVAVAFKLSVSANLPLISYLTYLDMYMLGVILYLCLNILLFASLSIIKDRAYAKDVDEYVLSCLVMAVVFFHMIFIYIFVSRTNVPIKEMLEKDRLYDKELAKMKQRKSSRVVKVVAREIPPPLNWKWSQDSQESESRVSPTSRYEETNHLLPLRINEIRRQGNNIQNIRYQ